MLDLILQLYSKISDLSGYLKNQEYERFEQIIKPFFEDMENIHKDYLLIFGSTKRYLQNGEISKASENLSVLRENHYNLRVYVRAVASELLKIKRLKKYHALLLSISDYFSELGAITFSKTREYDIRLIKLKNYLDLAQNEQEKARKLSELIEEIDKLIEHITLSWSKISMEYGKLLGKTF